MANGVDPMVNSVKPFTRRSPLHRAVIEAQLTKLLDRHDTMLPCGETVNHPIEVAC